MTKKILPIILVALVCLSCFFSCKKTPKSNADQTLAYFPVQLGKYVTYAVDSIVYVGDTSCRQYETRTQLKYSIDDTFRDSKNRLSYIMNVFSRPQEASKWVAVRVILLTPYTLIQTTTTLPPNTPITGLLYSQDGAQYEKMVFPIIQGQTWAGNRYVQVADSTLMYLKNWNYKYQDFHHSFNNGYVNYDNTVSVLEDDESVNYPQLDSAVTAYRIYAKEVYAYQVGMVYKEFTHWTYHPYNAKCVNGYTVIMRAMDHN